MGVSSTGRMSSAQRLAAGAMWVPGSFPLVLAVVLFAYRWLDDDGGERRPAHFLEPAR